MKLTIFKNKTAFLSPKAEEIKEKKKLLSQNEFGVEKQIEQTATKSKGCPSKECPSTRKKKARVNEILLPNSGRGV